MTNTARPGSSDPTLPTAAVVSRALLMLLLTGALSHAQAPSLHFHKVESKEALDWALQWEADRFGLTLRPGGYGIYPIDKNTVLLFGELTTPGASIRSFLLRSGDAGKTWSEVMSPLHGSRVLEAFFYDSRVGWALAGWTTEGPGDLALYGSKDGGKSWRKLSAIPKRHYLGWPVSMAFPDGRNGAIQMLYEDSGDPQTEGLVTLSTRDGGRTWRETRHLTLDEYKTANTETEEFGRKMAAGKDGSHWKLVDTDNELKILRRLQADDSWTLLCAIPRRFGYSKGEVLIHPPGR